MTTRSRLPFETHPSRSERQQPLSTDGQGYLANLADNIEAIQLGMGEDLLEYARDAVAPDAKVLSATEYRWLARRLTEALSDALRVADSRGQRLPDPEEVTADA
ncbi:hypothetical protein [Streptomyces thermocarboxydovorans]|uniref:hypothetical protein n=1 Tax=Streptomyces thermocarboxydovorans TaxID=59298 RepID=UPI0031DC247D